MHHLGGGVVGDGVVNALPLAAAVDVLQPELVIIRGGAHLGGLNGREGREGVQRQDAAVHEAFADAHQRGPLILRGEQVHEAAAGDDRQRILAGRVQSGHIRREDGEAEAHLGSLFLCDVAHGFGQIAAVDVNAVCGQVEQHRAGAAGDVDHAARAVFPGQVKVEILEALVIVVFAVHHVQVQVVVFGHVLVIMQVHGQSSLMRPRAACSCSGVA